MSRLIKQYEEGNRPCRVAAYLNNELQRTLAADDVAAFRYAMAGLDEIEGTGDDYNVVLVYAGQDAGADIVMKFDDSETSFAVTKLSGYFIDDSHAVITTAPVYFNNSYNWYFNSTLLSDPAPNDPPVITGQAPVSTPEETARVITLADLVVSDGDNTYPDDFSITVYDGADYVRSGAEITPVDDFNGTLSVPVSVNDGTDDSGVFSLQVTVTPVNDPPVITGQGGISTFEETPVTVSLDDLVVTDPDNAYPTGFSLSVQDGANYTRNVATVTPDAGFNGVLQVPVTVDDGTDPSNVFTLSIPVSAPVYVASDGLCGGKSPCSATVQGADTVAAGLAGTRITVLMREGTYAESVTWQAAKETVFSGGWDTGYDAVTGDSRIQGPAGSALEIRAGSVAAENIVLE